jgi:hypothetical protein
MVLMKQNEPNVAKKDISIIDFQKNLYVFTHCVWLSVPPVILVVASSVVAPLPPEINDGNGNGRRKRGINTARPFVSDTVAL